MPETAKLADQIAEVSDPLHLRLYKPREEDLKRMDEIRELYRRVALVVNVSCPSGRERSIALTNLETSLMYAIKSMAILGEPVNPIPVNP